MGPYFQPAFSSAWSFGHRQLQLCPNSNPTLWLTAIFYSHLTAVETRASPGALCLKPDNLYRQKAVQVPHFMLHNLSLLLKMKGYQQKFSTWFLLGEDISVHHATVLVCLRES